jgi:hypothetical protein
MKNIVIIDDNIIMMDNIAILIMMGHNILGAYSQLSRMTHL